MSPTSASQRSAEGAPLVVVRGLTKRYAALTALDRCDLAIQPGEVFGLLGPNGAGKTTLIRLLMGFLRPTSGEATIDGLDCHRDSVALHARVAYLPGDVRLFRNMRGRDVLRFFAQVRPQGDLARAEALAERLQLDLSRKVSDASTGMRQKLAVAAILSADVPLWIIDEPTANLDPTARQVVLDLVKQARFEGRTVIFSSHVMSEVQEVCDRVAVLRAGRLVHLQSMAELRRQHRITVKLAEVGPSPPPLPGGEAWERLETGQWQMDSQRDLHELLGYLATLSLADVRIEPAGLTSVYQRYHGPARE